MQDKHLCSFTFLRRKNGIVFLAFISFLGCLTGVFAALGAGNCIFPVMRIAVYSRVSIVGLLSTVFLPFFLSAIAVLFFNPRILYGLCFCKMFSFGFCISLLQQCFGTAGWFVCFFLLFSDGWVLFTFFLFWVRYLGGSKNNIFTFSCFCFISTVVICSLDYFLISPFWALLI